MADDDQSDNGYLGCEIRRSALENTTPIGYMFFRKEDIEYELLYDASEGEVSTLKITIHNVTILIMGETEDFGDGLRINGAHVQTDPPTARILSKRSMSIIAERILEDTGYAEIIICGAARTTGARKGNTPRELRFPRGNDPLV